MKGENAESLLHVYIFPEQTATLYRVTPWHKNLSHYQISKNCVKSY